MPNTDESKDDKLINEEEQKARSQLRKEFLRSLDRLSGNKCQVRLFSGYQDPKQTKSRILAFDRDILHLLIEDLATPTGLVSQAKVRATDVDSIVFQK